jgi:hypothetical protein
MHTTIIKIDTLAGIKKAEQAQAKLYSEYNNVRVVPQSTNAVQLQAWN